MQRTFAFLKACSSGQMADLALGSLGVDHRDRAVGVAGLRIPQHQLGKPGHKARLEQVV